MEERNHDIRVRCRLSILRLYPAHRQAMLTDRTDFNAWKAENVAHMNALMADPDADIDEGWPDPESWQTREPAEDPLERTLTNLEKAQAAMKPDEPPAAIADLFQADRPYAEQAQALWDKYNTLTNKIMLKVATPDEIEKHQRLQGELDWIKRNAFEAV